MADDPTDKLPDIEAEQPAPEKSAAAAPSLLATIAAVATLTLFAAGGGVGTGLLLTSVKSTDAGGQAQPAGTATPDEPPVANVEVQRDTIIKPLAPIVTNLAAPPGTWIRLQVSLLISKAKQNELDEIAARSAEKLLSYLRTVSLSQIEGPSGFLHLREDIADQLDVAADGDIREVIVGTLLIE